MRLWRWSLVYLLVLGLAPMQSARAESIWFSPRSEVADLMSLFRPDAPWQKAATAVTAFEISNTFALHSDKAALSLIFDDLRRRKIDLVVGLAPLAGPGPDRCGYNVEGYSASGEPYAVARRVEKLGGKPPFFVMDEPLYFGHTFQRDGEYVGCQLSIEEVARGVAQQLELVRRVYPSARFGDVEPLMGFSGDTWLADFSAWMDAYEEATGDKLAFFRLDIAWNLNWRERMPALTELLSRKGIPLQVIYNGDDNLQSDEKWIASAVAHFEDFEANRQRIPDAAVIQFWQAHPSHLLPETNPGSATWLINRYVQWRGVHR